MATEKVTANNMDFIVVTQRIVDLEVNRDLYDLLEIEDEGGFYNSHKSSWKINYLLNSIEEDGLEEYDNIVEEDVELLRACKILLDDRKVDVINFIEE